jgi:hypothetical protein
MDTTLHNDIMVLPGQENSNSGPIHTGAFPWGPNADSNSQQECQQRCLVPLLISSLVSHLLIGPWFVGRWFDWQNLYRFLVEKMKNAARGRL